MGLRFDIGGDLACCRGEGFGVSTDLALDGVLCGATFNRLISSLCMVFCTFLSASKGSIRGAEVVLAVAPTPISISSRLEMLSTT